MAALIVDMLLVRLLAAVKGRELQLHLNPDAKSNPLLSPASKVCVCGGGGGEGGGREREREKEKERESKREREGIYPLEVYLCIYVNMYIYIDIRM